MERSRIHQTLLLGAALGNRKIALDLVEADFTPDLRGVIRALKAKAEGPTNGEQADGKEWARQLYIDWDGPLIEQLHAYVAADAERERVDSVVHRLSILDGRQNSTAYMAAFRKLMGDLPKGEA